MQIICKQQAMRSTSRKNCSTSKSQEEESLKEDEFINLLPRAVLRKNTPILLDGEWWFSLDSEDLGLNENWYLDHNGCIWVVKQCI